MRFRNSAWHLLLSIHNKYPGWIPFYSGFVFLFLSIVRKPVNVPPVVYLTISFMLLLLSAVVAYHELENDKEKIEGNLTGKLDIEVTGCTKDRIDSSKIFGGVKYIVWEIGVRITNGSSLKNICLKKVWLEKRSSKNPAVVTSRPLERERLQRYAEIRPFLTYRINDIEDHPYLKPRMIVSGDFIFFDVAGITQEHLDNAFSAKHKLVLSIEDDSGNTYEKDIGER